MRLSPSSFLPYTSSSSPLSISHNANRSCVSVSVRIMDVHIYILSHLNQPMLLLLRGNRRKSLSTYDKDARHIHTCIHTNRPAGRETTYLLFFANRPHEASLCLSLSFSVSLSPLLFDWCRTPHHSTKHSKPEPLLQDTRIRTRTHYTRIISFSLSLSVVLFVCPVNFSNTTFSRYHFSSSSRLSLSLSVSLPLVYNDTHSTAITQSRRIYTHSHPNTSTCLSRTRRLRTNTSRITHALFCYDTTPKSQKRISIRISIDQSIKRDICRRRVDHGDSRVVVVVVVVVTRSVVLVLCIITEILICV